MSDTTGEQAKATTEAEGTAAGKGKKKEQLVTMVKGSETLDVHPTCVQAHMQQGWSVE